MRRIRYVRIEGRRPGLLGQILGLVAGITILVVSLVVGAVVIAAMLGLFVVASLVYLARSLWVGRGRPTQSKARHGDDVIEGEYREVPPGEDTRKGS